MKMSATTVRNGLYGMFAGGLLAFGSAAVIAPVANAQPAPGPTQDAMCSVSAIANTSSTVSASTSTYLASHPEANEALTEIAAQPQDRGDAGVPHLLRGEPAGRVRVEGDQRAGSDNLASQCGIEVTPTPISAALTDV